MPRWRWVGLGVALACLAACGSAGGHGGPSPTHDSASATAAPTGDGTGVGRSFFFLNQVSSACALAGEEFAVDGPQVNDLLAHQHRYHGQYRATALEALHDYRRAAHTLVRTLVRLRPPTILLLGYHRFTAALGNALAVRDLLLRIVEWRLHGTQGRPPVSDRRLQREVAKVPRDVAVVHAFATHHDLSQCDLAPPARPLKA